MFSGNILDKMKDITAVKCQLLTVLYFFVNSGQINILKDKVIIMQRFDSSRLMTWPLKGN